MKRTTQKKNRSRERERGFSENASNVDAFPDSMMSSNKPPTQAESLLDIDDTQSHLDDLELSQDELSNEADSDSDTSNIQSIVQEAKQQTHKADFTQPPTAVSEYEVRKKNKRTLRRGTDNEQSNHSSLSANTPPLTASFSQPSRQLHTKLRTAHGVLQQVQQDYQRCSRLSADYRSKHRQQMEMYLTMNKLLFLWHKGSTADNRFSTELLQVVQNANIMPDDELRALRKANDNVMKEVYNETVQIDKEYFSPNNPMFQDLTETQQREVLQNKQMAHQMLKKRLQLMNGLNAVDKADQRYRQAFSNSYFGEKGTLVNTAWGTDDVIKAKFDAFLQPRAISLHKMKCWSSHRNVLDAQEQKEIAKAVRLAQDLSMQGDDATLIADQIGFLAHVIQSTQPLSKPTQLTNIRPFLQQQPFFLLKDNEDEETKCSNWLQFANDVFQNELDIMFQKTNAFTTVKESDSIRLQFQNAVDNIVVLHQKDEKTTPHRAQLVMDTNDTRACFLSEAVYGRFTGTIDKQLVAVEAIHDMQNLSKQIIGSHYIAVAGTTSHRTEALAQLVWRACVESGQYYPVIPSLHFISGLDSEQMTHAELSFWYNEADLTTHIKHTQSELTHPVHDTDHLQGTFREMNEEDDAFKLWREHFARDTRAFVAVRDMNDEGFQNQDITTHTQLVEDLYVERLSLTVGGVYDEAHPKKGVGEYCVRLFLYMTDDSNTEWLDKDKTDVSEQKDIIDANKHKTVHVDKDDAWFDSNGALLIALYEQLGKTRANVFAPNAETLKPEDVFQDIENALDMQLELLEHMVVNGLDASTAHEIYNKAFFAETKAHDGKIVFCWRTFKNVFGVSQLNPWQREVDPVCVAKDLKQTLHLDLVEGADPMAKIDPRVVFDCVDIVHDRAYGRNDDRSGENTVVSSSHVHLLRLMLWNMGIWNLPLNNTDITKAVEQHVDTLVAYGHHPFGEQLSIEDVVYGHPSPLLVARLFVACARFVNFTASEREQQFAHFKTAYDNVVLHIRHPVFLAMLLKFRGHFIHRPHEHYLHKLWNLVDMGAWKQNMFLWNHLLEYALAVEFIGNPKLYKNRDYFQECQLLFRVSKTVGSMKDDDVAKIRQTLKDSFVENRVGTNTNPKALTDKEVGALQQKHKLMRRREGDMNDEHGAQ